MAKASSENLTSLPPDRNPCNMTEVGENCDYVSMEKDWHYWTGQESVLRRQSNAHGIPIEIHLVRCILFVL